MINQPILIAALVGAVAILIGVCLMALDNKRTIIHLPRLGCGFVVLGIDVVVVCLIVTLVTWVGEFIK